MLISLIAALDEAGGIGKEGRLPWHLRADLQRFKRLTLGHPVIMGRKTYETIRRPLPGRTNLVITRQPDYQAQGCQVVHSLAEALAIAENASEPEAFVIGGGEIFAKAMPLADRLYLTYVQTRAGCDVFFPAFAGDDWKAVQTDIQSADEQNEFPSVFEVLEQAKR
jgi:dihydrofolate reductase